MYGGDMPFGPPEDWCPEDADDIEATKAVYDLFVDMLAEGHKVDVLTVWASAAPTAVTTVDVSLSEVARDSFRFVENYKFNLKR
jgi:predicted membrane GTPase involved in stress response